MKPQVLGISAEGCVTCGTAHLVMAPLREMFALQQDMQSLVSSLPCQSRCPHGWCVQNCRSPAESIAVKFSLKNYSETSRLERLAWCCDAPGDCETKQLDWTGFLLCIFSCSASCLRNAVCSVKCQAGRGENRLLPSQIYS